MSKTGVQGGTKSPLKKKYIYIYIYIYIILYNIIYILYYIILYYIGAGALYGDYRALQGHMFHTSYPSRRLLKHVTCSHVGMCGYARGGSGNTPRVVILGRSRSRACECMIAHKSWARVIMIVPAHAHAHHAHAHTTLRFIPLSPYCRPPLPLALALVPPQTTGASPLYCTAHGRNSSY